MATLTIPPRTGVFPVTAGEAITKYHFVDASGGYAAANGDRAIGVAVETVASGEEVSVQTTGIAIVEAGGSITAGAAVQTNTAGEAIAVADPTADLDAGYKVLGHALDAGSDGDNIRVLLSC